MTKNEYDTEVNKLKATISMQNEFIKKYLKTIDALKRENKELKNKLADIQCISIANRGNLNFEFNFR